VKRGRRFRRIVALVILAAAAAVAGVAFHSYGLRHPEAVPWTPLDLGQPVGAFTGRKLAGLVDDGPHCRALLSRAGVRYAALPPRRESPQCWYDDAVAFRSGGAVTIAYRPDGLGTSCPVAAALAMWEWQVVQPAARRHFGRPVATIDHFGSYSCRRLYGRNTGAWSAHARAGALDIAGFRLSDGTSINVAADWRDRGAKGAFLHDVRDGACRLFTTVLSPDYNIAHRDHFHLDEADRGQWGWQACR
jgi:hypothetical protein